MRSKPTPVDREASDDAVIDAYAHAQSPTFQAICDRLRAMIDTALPEATSKVWHGIPVWFLEENPVVGYSANAKSVNLLFWNGQAFDDERLKPVGKYGAAQAIFVDIGEIDPKAIRGWLKKAQVNVFDSKAFFKKMRDERRRNQ